MWNGQGKKCALHYWSKQEVSYHSANIWNKLQQSFLFPKSYHLLIIKLISLAIKTNQPAFTLLHQMFTFGFSCAIWKLSSSRQFNVPYNKFQLNMDGSKTVKLKCLLHIFHNIHQCSLTKYQPNKQAKLHGSWITFCFVN